MGLETRDLYSSTNGDKWLLARELGSGRVFVRHIPNLPSGGKTTDIEIGAFLCERNYGPQHIELLRLIGTLVEKPCNPGVHESESDCFSSAPVTRIPAMKLAPIIPIRRNELPPEKDGWAWELKLDGFRGLADTIKGKMISKNLNPLKRFQHLLDALPFDCVFDRPVFGGLDWIILQWHGPALDIPARLAYCRRSSSFSTWALSLAGAFP